MTTVKGFIKAANTSYKRAARKQRVNLTEAAKHQQQNLKQQIKDDSINAVQTYNEYIQSLLSVHKECIERIDWDSFSQEPCPKLPFKQAIKQFEAEYNYQTYEPSFMDYVLLKSKKKLNSLLEKIELAKHADDLIYNGILKEFKNDAESWRKIQSITKGVRAEDPVAYKDAIDFFDPLAQVSQLGSQLEFEIFSHYIIVNVYINPDIVIPDYVLSQAASGKLSNRKMTKQEFNKLYQDYVCGCVLRIAREIFALLPVAFVFVNAVTDLLNTATGYTESKVILSVKFDHDKLEGLNFETLDCSDSLVNFPHHMKFSVNDGFSGLDVLAFENYTAAE